MENLLATEKDAATDDNRQIRQLMVFFAVAYFVQMIGQRGGLIGQPLLVYLKSQGLSPVRFSQFEFLIGLPWIIKPVYGLLSDFVPLLGYHRRSYLLLMNAVAALGFCCITGLETPAAIGIALFISSIGVAFTDVVVDAIMVERGQYFNRVKQFQGQQWLWFSIAAVLATLSGGYLAQHFLPGNALRLAAPITGIALLILLPVSWVIAKEPKAVLNTGHFGEVRDELKKALRSKSLWIVGIFLLLWNFDPSFGTPLQYILRDQLKLGEMFLGTLNTVAAIGSIVGALWFERMAGHFRTRQLICGSAIAGAIVTLGFLFLLNHIVILLLFFLAGIMQMFATLSLLSLAGEICPPKVAGVIFATFASIMNFASQSSDLAGSKLYESVFHSHLAPLIWTSAIFTITILIIVPWLPKTDIG